MKIAKGNYLGREISRCPADLIWWLANESRSSERDSFYGIRDLEEEITPEMIKEAKEICEHMQYASDRLDGMEGESTEYIVSVTSGDSGDIRAFAKYDEVFLFLKETYDELSVEDDLICVWEVLATGHKKIVWQFYGWKHDGYADEGYNFSQGAYPGDEKSLLEILTDIHNGRT